jgi:hypothetical protein
MAAIKDPKVLTGAIALIKVDNLVIGKMKTVRCQESIRRIPVRGLGTILPSEEAVTEWEGTLSCEFMSVDFKNEGIANAIRRIFPNIASQVLDGVASFEDQLVLDTVGVQVDIYKKVADAVNADGTIKPTAVPYAIVQNCLIESDGFDISEGGIAGHSQSFKYLTPLTYTT